MDFGKVTIAQHEKLCQAIMGQVELKSLQLACYVQKNFMACYMPFFGKQNCALHSDGSQVQGA
ncbi:hypothetical protein [Variovorax sp. RA8]|uniref:hypothetical protein n=1 Tax=Variovorax sp. (strain JCM 16519 / RA8) TaxID=662548 RepID=UPI000A812F53|nr:hypothetical protein [Variovorax sp. RA8]VTU38177.1 hypothetical protein RA8CHR_05912 [Variovorax sp. RA8]